MNTTASSDEKIMAALVHGSVLLMFLGPIVPVILWASQRKKSKYVRFHALQAMGYQTFTFWLWIAVMLAVTILSVFLLPLASAFIQTSRDGALIPLLFQVPIFLAMFGFMAFFFITGVVGAAACLLGREFRYPFLGRWLERYLGYDADPQTEIAESQEDNWVAGVCHATAILQMWGVVTPLIVWFSQRERSARLRFQSLQAFVYQLIWLAAYMLGMAAYMFVFFGMFLALIAGSAGGSGGQIEGPGAIVMLLSLATIVIVWLLVLIVLPAYYVLAGLAGVRVLGGHNFRYPILGRIIERRVEASQPVELAP